MGPIAGRNPIRRNRAIGTRKQGHGQNNRFVVPNTRHDSRMPLERLGPHTFVERQLGALVIPIIVERTRPDFVHACTVDDIARVLSLVPAEDLTGICCVVLRQPTRKQYLLDRVWGRLQYAVDIGRLSGPAIYLEAVHRAAREHRRQKSLDPHDATRLERLRGEGHRIITTPREHCIVTTPEAARTTQLYFTLLHEVGHWVHRTTAVEVPAKELVDRTGTDPWLELWETYFSKPSREREEFADRYADELASRLRLAGAIPFDRVIDEAQMKRDRLHVEDFVW